MNPPVVRRIPIDNYRARTDEVSGALIHSMSERILANGEEIYATDFLDEMGLSVHAMITPDGTVIECVPPEYVAFHAGVSRFNGERWLNRSFLGCEFLVAGVHDWTSFVVAITENAPYTDAQYRSGGWLYASWMLRFPQISLPRIVAHSSVSGDDVRGAGKGKIDPGPAFDRRKFDEWLGRWVAELTSN